MSDGPRSSITPRRPDASPLNVLFVAEAFGGGMFEITRMSAEGLARLGHSVAIADGRRLETPSEVRAVVDSSVDLIPLPWASRSLAAQLRAQRSLRAVLRARRPDIVHLMSSFAGLQGVLAARGSTSIYTPQAYSFTMSNLTPARRWAYLAIESFVAGRVSAVGACSLSEGEQARSLPGHRTVVIVPNGIDELSADHIIESPRPSPARPRVVAMGRPLPQRQPEACARILSAVAASGGAEVRWLGGGDEGTPGYRALREAGIEMTGWSPRPQTLHALGESSVYLHWTAWDGLPLSVLEAMALDVVVIANDIGPNRELVGPAQVCRSEREAIELIDRVLRDPELRGALIDDQRRRRALYGADAMVQRWADVYRSLLHREQTHAL